MADTNDTDHRTPKRGHPRLGRKGRFAILAVLLVGLGVTAGTVIGHSGPGGGWHRGGGWHHGGHHGRLSNPEHALDRIAWVLGYVDATEEQQAAIREIAESALEDLRPLMDTHRDARRAFLTAITRPEVDRAAVEEIRAKELVLLDEGSARALDALTDVANVLTAEQRAQLADHASRFLH